jgi:hypothetical protein
MRRSAYVPIANVQRTIGIFIDLFKRYVPIEDQPALLEDLRLSTRCDESV